MEGYGEAYSAITVLNAFATGIGSAIGIDLKVRVRVKRSDEYRLRVMYMGREIPVDSRLVDTIVDYFRSRFHLEDELDIFIDTDIPPKVGLKSSSAVSNALITAMIDYLGIEMEEYEILSLNSTLSLKAGVSVTGALDDAAASLKGGLVVTNNLRREILYREEIGRKEVLIVFLKGERETGRYRGIDFSPIRDAVEFAGEMLLRGLWREVAVLNGLIYSGYLGLNPKPIFKALEMGAETAGLSGKGPAYYMIGGDMERYASEMEAIGYRTIWTWTR